MEVKLIAITKYLHGTPEQLIEHAGRICYRSQGTDTEKFIKSRIAAGHESILEHASATFEISGISRACSHQLVRHRMASYSQESQRYVDMSDPEFVMPIDILGDDDALQVWYDTMWDITVAYRELRALGIRKEDARFILPNATATRIIVTMNFRELLHVFRIRISPEAQWEIREVCTRMLRLIEKEAPSVLGVLDAP